MSLSAACAAVGIEVPRKTKPGAWVQCPVVGKGRSNGSGRVLIWDDGKGGVAWNWITGQQQRFTAEGLAGSDVRPPKRDKDAERRDRERQQAATEAAQAMVKAATPAVHPYLIRKGFPDEMGLVLEMVTGFVPAADDFDGMRHNLGKMAAPFLIVPGRIGQSVATVQIIDAEGVKLNMKAAPMKGAAHRIATGRETWVCEGIATALSVRAALRLLGRSATVFSAFSAANVATVAGRMTGAIIAADHDKPLPQLHDMGTGEFYARQSGCRWVQPTSLGDFNDMHQTDGLRAVALCLRGSLQ